ncbi:hypothetical protein GCM10007079_34030 [Nocardiopsis terrae]|uniref:Integral membrane protein n=1 Tax=Nocardiopsis terrae TaxID=372655 RepID=A0ABR9HJL6_9ACTN|nr:hypothetical protein [Nocardiopsis terrae]MBE1459215.1 hypothetical protein [Nocardiopsis terrae]GHC88792.1 hypothetical protein GCM10007079_34030 [Nocardiopsis terrae]
MPPPPSAPEPAFGPASAVARLSGAGAAHVAVLLLVFPIADSALDGTGGLPHPVAVFYGLVLVTHTLPFALLLLVVRTLGRGRRLVTHPTLPVIGAVPSTVLYALFGISLVSWEPSPSTVVLTLFLALFGFGVQVALCHLVLRPKRTSTVTLFTLALPALVWGLALVGHRLG